MTKTEKNVRIPLRWVGLGRALAGLPAHAKPPGGSTGSEALNAGAGLKLYLVNYTTVEIHSEAGILAMPFVQGMKALYASEV